MLIRQIVVILAILMTTLVYGKKASSQQIIRVPLKQRKRQQHEKRSVFNSTVYNYKGSLYIISVSVGTPPQTFDLALDTGSSDLWVPGSRCPRTVCPYDRFNESQSSSFQSSDKVFNISYGTGSASGSYAFDSVSIAGATIKQQQFGYVTRQKNVLTQISTLSGDSDYTPTADEQRFEGIFGLGYPSITASASPYDPFFFNLKDQIPQAVFSIYLNSSNDIAGEIVLGGIDPSMYSGRLHYLPLALTEQTLGYGFWQVYGQGIGVVNNTLTTVVAFQTPAAFVFDTGTTMTYLPTKAVETILYEAVGRSNVAYDSLNHYYQIECSVARQTETSIQLQLTPLRQTTDSPVLFNVPLRDLVLPLDTNDLSSASVCMVGLIPSDGTVFIGQSMLRGAYLVFDADQNRLGIARAVGSGVRVSGPLSSGSAGVSTQNTIYCSLFLLVYFFL